VVRANDPAVIENDLRSAIRKFFMSDRSISCINAAAKEIALFFFFFFSSTITKAQLSPLPGAIM